MKVTNFFTRSGIFNEQGQPVNQFSGVVVSAHPELKQKFWKTYFSQNERAWVPLHAAEDALAFIEAKYVRLIRLLMRVGNYSYTEAMALVQGREVELSLMNGGRDNAIKKVLMFRH